MERPNRFTAQPPTEKGRRSGTSVAPKKTNIVGHAYATVPTLLQIKKIRNANICFLAEVSDRVMNIIINENIPISEGDKGLKGDCNAIVRTYPVLKDGVALISEVHDACINSIEDARAYSYKLKIWEEATYAEIRKAKTEHKKKRFDQIKENHKRNSALLKVLETIILDIAIAGDIDDPKGNYDTINLCDEIARLHPNLTRPTDKIRGLRNRLTHE